MKRDRKIHTQGTGKEENRVDNIRPDTGEQAATDEAANTGAAPLPGAASNEGNQVTADIKVGREDTPKSNTDIFSNNNTTNNYAQEVDINPGGVALDKSPGATNKGNNPSNASLATPQLATPQNDNEAISRSGNGQAEKQAGSATGAINGNGNETIAVKRTTNKKPAAPAPAANAKKRAAPKQEPAIIRLYGQIQADNDNFFIQQGNVPAGQLQLMAGKDIMDRIADFNGQMVSIAGRLNKKNKADKYASFNIHTIASHEAIGRRAYELSHQNPAAVEDNWLKAENELLQV